MQNKFVAVLLIGASLLGLNGYTAVGATQNNIDHEFLDSYGEYRLVERNNDIYMEKLDGSESRQITHTPKITETFAFISKGGKYIVYKELNPYAKIDKFYIIKSDSDDSTRKEITQQEGFSIRSERDANNNEE